MPLNKETKPKNDLVKIELLNWDQNIFFDKQEIKHIWHF